MSAGLAYSVTVAEESIIGNLGGIPLSGILFMVTGIRDGPVNWRLAEDGFREFEVDPGKHAVLGLPGVMSREDAQKVGLNPRIAVEVSDLTAGKVYLVTAPRDVLARDLTFGITLDGGPVEFRVVGYDPADAPDPVESPRAEGSGSARSLLARVPGVWDGRGGRGTRGRHVRLFVESSGLTLQVGLGPDAYRTRYAPVGAEGPGTVIAVQEGSAGAGNQSGAARPDFVLDTARIDFLEDGDGLGRFAELRVQFRGPDAVTVSGPSTLTQPRVMGVGAAVMPGATRGSSIIGYEVDERNPTTFAYRDWTFSEPGVPVSPPDAELRDSLVQTIGSLGSNRWRCLDLIESTVDQGAETVFETMQSGVARLYLIVSRDPRPGLTYEVYRDARIAAVDTRERYPAFYTVDPTLFNKPTRIHLYHRPVAPDFAEPTGSSRMLILVMGRTPGDYGPGCDLDRVFNR